MLLSGQTPILGTPEEFERQSKDFGLAQSLKWRKLADGQVEPSGQQELPEQRVPDTGQTTASPKRHSPAVILASAKQLYPLGLGQPWNDTLADGHVEPSGQQLLPAHCTFNVLLQRTASPTLQVGAVTLFHFTGFGSFS
jgi:hypothetical protein